MKHISVRRDVFQGVYENCLLSGSQEVQGSAAAWRLDVGRECDSTGAANMKECLPVSSLTDGLCSVTTEDERVERDDWSFSF